MALNHKDYYRLPWSISDNIFSWLEPTKECNIYCEGCYSENTPGSHKTVDQIRVELDILTKLRKSDGICIAGGEPLIHPQITDIVRMVADRGYKPMLNTNAVAMTEELMRELKSAGLKKLTFHIDSHQQRPGWTGKSETELNELRLSLARMAHKVGGLYCTFNSTIYADTLKDAPELVRWAQENIDVVQGLCFIVFRAAGPNGTSDPCAKGRKSELSDTWHREQKGVRADISIVEVVEEIRKAFPDYEPCAYLNAVAAPDLFKWLFAIRIGTKDTIYGYFGPKFMEMAQELYHFLTGKYLGPVDVAAHRKAKKLFLAAVIDKGAGRALSKYCRMCLKEPGRFYRPAYMQIITMLNPIYNLSDGRQAMCDGCPDMTVWNGRLVASCRLDELTRYG